MSALTDLFTAMANKIRSKTGTSTTYTPLQMVSDGIDDVYAAGYDAGGGGGGGGIPITPSNVSPVSLTQGESYELLANGYAITSYTNLTPSNANPVSISDGTIYKANGAGKAVASVTDITPSDSSPAAMTSGTIYKAGGAGYAIASSPTNISQSQLDAGVYFSSGIKKMAGSGYAYSSQQSLYNLTKAATVKNGGTGSATQSFTAVVNRRYLVIAVRFSSSGTASNAGISSGATVDTQFINNQSSYSGQGKLWAAIVKATATTVIMQGSNVVCCYMPLDD